MDYKIIKIGAVDNGFGAQGLVLGDVFSIEKTGDDQYTLREECDGWYTEELTKKELLLMLDEIKNWIENE